MPFVGRMWTLQAFLELGRKWSARTQEEQRKLRQGLSQGAVIDAGRAALSSVASRQRVALAPFADAFMWDDYAAFQCC